jgi:hypothetical protein
LSSALDLKSASAPSMPLNALFVDAMTDVCGS